MEKNFWLRNCGDDDALSFNTGMFKGSQLITGIKEVCRREVAKALFESLKLKGLEINPGWSHIHQSFAYWKWFDEGIDCEVLKIGAKGWQKGKVRIKVTLEFCPDEPEVEETPINQQTEISEPESPLDDLRQLINPNNHHSNS